MAIVAVFALLYQRILVMDPIFFQRSPAGAGGLPLYLVGDYTDAARAYRGHVRAAARSGGAGDPAANAIIAGDLDRDESRAIVDGPIRCAPPPPPHGRVIPLATA
jgi:hypothetical protein